MFYDVEEEPDHREVSNPLLTGRGGDDYAYPHSHAVGVAGSLNADAAPHASARAFDRVASLLSGSAGSSAGGGADAHGSGSGSGSGAYGYGDGTARVNFGDAHDDDGSGGGGGGGGGSGITSADDLYDSSKAASSSSSGAAAASATAAAASALYFRSERTRAALQKLRRGLRPVPIRPTHWTYAALGLVLPVLWLMACVAALIIALNALFRSKAPEETCAHAALDDYVLVTAFHACGSALLMALYLRRLVSQLRATHLYIQMSLGSDEHGLVGVSEKSGRVVSSGSAGSAGAAGVGVSGVSGSGVVSDVSSSDGGRTVVPAVTLPLPFVYRESWADVVLEYVLSRVSVGSACALALFGELTCGGIGLLNTPAYADCDATAPILFGAAATLSLGYSVVLLLVIIFLIRRYDAVIVGWCQ